MRADGRSEGNLANQRAVEGGYAQPAMRGDGKFLVRPKATALYSNDLKEPGNFGVKFNYN